MTGEASQSIQLITSGTTSWRSTGASVFMPFWLSLLAIARADVDEFDEALNSINEAVACAATTKETWCEAEVHRVAGEITLKLPGPDVAKAEAYFERALEVACQQQAKSWELRAPMSLARTLACPGQGAASARTACSGLRLVYGRLRHARSEGGQGVVGGVGGVVVCYVWRCLNPNVAPVEQRGDAGCPKKHEN